ncbi:MAG: tyrosine-type recombinase/integrase [Eubacteriaceae bacterium]|nr:tyrosine-type recombinase/integrase [Eubacteriaceae bacterium]
MARHTFATTITLTNGVPIETVSKLLGHNKIATTQIYAKVIERKVSDDMNALKLVLTKNKEEFDLKNSESVD